MSKVFSLLVKTSFFAFLILQSCGMSESEKRFIGNYFIPEVSDSEPVFELHSDGTSIYRAGVPGELSVRIPGKWHVERNNQLVFDNDLKHTIIKGDSSRLGSIAPKIERKILSFNNVSLVVLDKGIQYCFRRRVSE